MRRDLLNVLTSDADVLADYIRPLRERGDDDLADVLTELQADDVLRAQVVAVLPESLKD